MPLLICHESSKYRTSSRMVATCHHNDSFTLHDSIPRASTRDIVGKNQALQLWSLLSAISKPKASRRRITKFPRTKKWRPTRHDGHKSTMLSRSNMGESPQLQRIKRFESVQVPTHMAQLTARASQACPRSIKQRYRIPLLGATCAPQQKRGGRARKSCPQLG